MSNSGVVNIKGKDYKTVALRISEFWFKYQDWSVTTDIIDNNDNSILMKCIVTDEKGRVRGTGFAEEIKGSTNINKTSAIENCETSSIGRALSCIGLAGSEYASANEVSEALLAQQRVDAENETKEFAQSFITHNEAVRANISTICAIKEGIKDNDYSPAAEEWFLLDNDIKMMLWKAPSKGGIFTTHEREILKTTEFKEAYYGPTDKSD
jgi:hypothetical protein